MNAMMTPATTPAETATTHDILADAAQKCIRIRDLATARQLLGLLDGGAPIAQTLPPALVLPGRQTTPRGSKAPSGQSGTNHPKYDDLKKFVMSTGRAIVPELSAQFGLNAYQVKRMLVALADEGVVSAEGEPRRGRSVLKRLSPDGVLSEVKPSEANVGPSHVAGRRTQAQLDEIKERVLAAIAANPGQRVEEINTALGTNTADLTLPIHKLIDEGAIRAKGTRRATRYFPAGHEKAAPKKVAKKTTPKKAAAKKSAKRAKKATAKKAAPKVAKRAAAPKKAAKKSKPAVKKAPAVPVKRTDRIKRIKDVIAKKAKAKPAVTPTATPAAPPAAPAETPSVETPAAT